MRCQNVADVSSIRTNSAHGGGLLRRPNRVVAAIDGESKRRAEMPDGSGLADRLLRGDDFVTDFGSAGGDHADILSSSAGEIKDASANERSTVVDANDDAAAIMLVDDLETRAESKRAMGGSKVSGTHTFPGSSFGASSVP